LLCWKTERLRALVAHRQPALEEGDATMAWTTPILVEICIGLEINGYLPAEF
jgi:coenzyme PQQ precursor peptide PqqA